MNCGATRDTKAFVKPEGAEAIPPRSEPLGSHPRYQGAEGG